LTRAANAMVRALGATFLAGGGLGALLWLTPGGLLQGMPKIDAIQAPGSTGRLGDAGLSADTIRWFMHTWSHSWLDGQPLLDLLLPATLDSASRAIPALCLTVLVARLLAPRQGSTSRRARGLLRILSMIPAFVLGYLLIIGINRITFALLPPDALPGWFALPIGDGATHPAKWLLEVLVLAMGDGLLALGLVSLREEVLDIRSRPYVLAATINTGTEAFVLSRHLRGPTLALALVLLPPMLGSLLVVEPLFQEAGLGFLLVDRLQARDLPVVSALLGAGVLLASLAHAVAALVTPHEYPPSVEC